LIKQNISGEVDAIKENIQVMRTKLRPLLNKDLYIEDVERLIEVIPEMLENVESMADELGNAFRILSDAPKKD